jgi:hypothetical protein
MSERGFKTFTLASLANKTGFPLGELVLGQDTLGKTVVSSGMTIHPTFDYSESVNRQQNFNRSETGMLNHARMEGGYYRFSIPFSVTNSSDTNDIRGYWNRDESVRFSITDFEKTEYVDCRIANVNDPFSSYTKHRFINFDGILTLISLNDQNTGRGIQKNIAAISPTPFILDDTIQGILDNIVYRLG